MTAVQTLHCLQALIFGYMRHIGLSEDFLWGSLHAVHHLGSILYTSIKSLQYASIRRIREADNILVLVER